MSRTKAARDISLKSLELFQVCAKEGSLQAAARDAGLTVSTVSHHLRSLEDHLGVELFNHARRPMVLTPKGQVFSRKIDEALRTIRRAKAEASAGSVADASFLRIGAIEDFESDIVPYLAVSLTKMMPTCDFMYHTGVSHDLIGMLRNRQLDLGICTAPGESISDLQERPLLRDPFIIVLPRLVPESLTQIMEGTAKLPFLRFSGNLMIARQIDTHLRRLGVTSPHRFECSNNQTLMAMVAASAGWTITTPLLFSRAKRFHGDLRMHRFPGKAFARTLALMTTPDCSRSVVELVDAKVRDLIRQHAIEPLHASEPWLAESFQLID
ncbi:HTH-type transcriptional regulator GltR [Sulfitobacter sp. DSM 110093]|uniref:LysR family transcriptional regulator n=1 Tax=Sulfitobacter sp. DSM 110093 TaxID=2883127 RepID=UPI001FAD28CF|nr:LysR family transcriptional regulator [Sulfitobacter sp. DSM 110093]UOA30549.1 HTH-type transcriptional regulator GltR [Sulfitobacter sp. DSM 110093]